MRLWYTDACMNESSSRTRARSGAARAAICIIAVGALCAGPTFAASLDVDLSFVASGFAGLPPDTMGAAGPAHVVTFTNGGVEIFRKSDGQSISHEFLGMFWFAAGVSNLSDTFDPRVVYDPGSGRFFAVSLEGRFTSNQILVAVSSSADPTQPWTGFALDSDSTDVAWADFPTIGVDADTVTIAADMHAVGEDALPIAVDVLVIPKADLLTAQPTLAGATLFERRPLATTGFAPQPVTRLDGAGLPNWLFSSGVAFVGVIQTAAIAGTPTSPTVAAGPLLRVDPMPTPPEAVQPSTTALDTGDGHFASLVGVGDSIWGVHGATGASGRAAIRWYEFDASSAAVLQSGVIDDPNRDFLYPSIAANALGQVVIGFSASSASLLPSAFAALGETMDGVTTFQEPILVRAGAGIVSGGSVQRFGDYSATVVDPADASRFWTFQEVGGATGNGTVAVASLRVVPEPEAAQSLLICGLVLRALAAGRSGHCDRTTRRRTLRRLAWRRETPTRETRRA